MPAAIRRRQASPAWPRWTSRRIDDFSAAGLNAVEAGGTADGDCRSGVGSDRNDGRGNGGHRRRSRNGAPQPAGAATVQRLASNPRGHAGSRAADRCGPWPGGYRGRRSGSRLAVFAAPLAGAGVVVWILATVRTGAAHGTDGLDPIGAALLLCGPIALLAVFLARNRWPRLGE